MTINPPVIPHYTMDWYLLSSINYHIDTLINRYSRLYAARIDLSYRKGSYRYQSSSPRSMDYELRLLMAAMMEVPAVVGYFCVMEWTEDHGFHAHVVLWLDGHVTQKPFPYAEKAGALWQDITQGDGFLYRCEKKASYQADINIPVRYNDPTSIFNIRYILSYLAKEEQKDGVLWHIYNEVPPRPSAGRPRLSGGE